MTQEISQNDKEIANRVRKRLRELGVYWEEMVKRLKYTRNRVFGLVFGLKHWTRNDKEKFVIDLGLWEGRAKDKTGKSIWEQIEGLTDEELDELLRGDSPHH